MWLTQKAQAELFGVKVPAINKHLKNIFDSGELTPEATISKMEIVRAEGSREVSREVEFYNLDAIIAVGYRVNSHQATQFRIWATKTLREFIIKGFVMDDARLKRGKQTFGQDWQIGQQAADQLPWFHIVTRLTKVAERKWYAVQAASQGWSRLATLRCA